MNPHLFLQLFRKTNHTIGGLSQEVCIPSLEAFRNCTDMAVLFLTWVKIALSNLKKCIIWTWKEVHTTMLNWPTTAFSPALHAVPNTLFATVPNVLQRCCFLATNYVSLWVFFLNFWVVLCNHLKLTKWIICKYKISDFNFSIFGAVRVSKTLPNLYHLSLLLGSEAKKQILSWKCQNIVQYWQKSCGVGNV